ncbi:type VII secretion protein EccE [Actinoplanes sp. GCM10030250]|uniref:type VII secretion protein EccE n=1 Tax=Actinoplanes sp. GCM10030250 TaxID=3273376 RepID=UPI0036129926
MSIKTGPSQPAILNGRRPGVRLNQIVATQMALALILLGTTRGGAMPALAGLCAAALLALTWVRTHDRWAFGWLAALVRFATRRRAAHLDSPASVLAFVAPRTLVTTADLAGAPAAVLSDEFGLSVLLELTDHFACLPSLATLLPTPEKDQPPTRLQLVLTGVPPPTGRGGSGPAAGSYRTLSDGNSLAQFSAVLALRVLRADGWSDEELRRSLVGQARRLMRRLRTYGARPLDRPASVRVIAESAHAPPLGKAREFWDGVRLGEHFQTTFQCCSAPGTALPGHVIAQLLGLPASATTVSVTAALNPQQPESLLTQPGKSLTQPGNSLTPPANSLTRPGSLLVRLAAPDATAIGKAAQSLSRLLTPEGVELLRWDGSHLPGLSDTLPLGGWFDPTTSFNGFDAPVVRAGLILGRNREGGPVRARLFRPDPTLVALIGGLPCAQLVVFRALATGAQVTVRSSRPQDWAPFVRGAAAPGGSITVLPMDQPLDPSAGSPVHPSLTIIDSGQASATDGGSGSGSGGSGSGSGGSGSGSGGSGALDCVERWHTTLVVRDVVSTGDLEIAARADLLILQPLEADEAALLGEALSLGETADLLTRMRATMIAVVSRSSVRWAALAETPIEKVLIGDPSRPLRRRVAAAIRSREERGLSGDGRGLSEDGRGLSEDGRAPSGEGRMLSDKSGYD